MFSEYEKHLKNSAVPHDAFNALKSCVKRIVDILEMVEKERFVFMKDIMVVTGVAIVHHYCKNNPLGPPSVSPQSSLLPFNLIDLEKRDPILLQFRVWLQRALTLIKPDCKKTVLIPIAAVLSEGAESMNKYQTGSRQTKGTDYRVAVFHQESGIEIKSRPNRRRKLNSELYHPSFNQPMQKFSRARYGPDFLTSGPFPSSSGWSSLVPSGETWQADGSSLHRDLPLSREVEQVSEGTSDSENEVGKADGAASLSHQSSSTQWNQSESRRSLSSSNDFSLPPFDPFDHELPQPLTKPGLSVDGRPMDPMSMISSSSTARPFTHSFVTPPTTLLDVPLSAEDKLKCVRGLTDRLLCRLTALLRVVDPSVQERILECVLEFDLAKHSLGLDLDLWDTRSMQIATMSSGPIPTTLSSIQSSSGEIS